MMNTPATQKPPCGLFGYDFDDVTRSDMPFPAASATRPTFAEISPAADFAFYPMVAFLRRAQIKLPDLDADGMLPPAIAAWKARIEALPFFDKTIPPHWKAS